MNLNKINPIRRRSVAAFTLVETLIAVALTTVVLGSMMSLYTSGAISFNAMGNYLDMDTKSYRALDLVSREIRNSNLLLSYTNNQTLVFSNNYANNGTGQITKIAYDPSSGTVIMTRTGQKIVSLLTGCDQFSFQLYNHAPDTTSFTTDIAFYAATNATQCKMIQLSWKCTRNIMGSKLTTESVQTAQIVLRNKTQ